jgi:capsular exopolysaccharide synthesis family protein
MRSEKSGLAIEVKEQAKEPVAQLCANLYLNRTDGGPRVLAITSSEEGEGRSSLALALGVELAQTLGEAALVMEANFRNPGLSKLAGLSKDSAGLAEMLAGKAGQDDVITPLGTVGPEILTAGQVTRDDIASLMDRSKVEMTLKSLSARYKYILMEVPPINKYPEALVLSRLADAAVLSIRAGVTGRESVMSAVKRLELLGDKFVGLVLNQKQYPLPGWLYKRL